MQPLPNFDLAAAIDAIQRKPAVAVGRWKPRLLMIALAGLLLVVGALGGVYLSGIKASLNAPALPLPAPDSCRTVLDELRQVRETIERKCNQPPPAKRVAPISK